MSHAQISAILYCILGLTHLVAGIGAAVISQNTQLALAQLIGGLFWVIVGIWRSC